MHSPLRYRYRTMDVFTTRQLEGNQLAVFPEANGLDAPTMQRIARELNLPETVFIFPPSGSEFPARLRIFTAARELDFAGHPTIGAGFVLVDERVAAPRDGRFAVEENIGAIAIRIDDGDPPKLWLTTPPIRDGRLVDRSVCATALGIDERDLLDLQPQVLDAGNPTLLIALRDASAVDRVTGDARSMGALRGPDGKLLCVLAFTPTPEGAYSRVLALDHGVVEDPATGSATGPLALYMMRHGLVAAEGGTHFVSEQGTKMGRRSMVHVHIKSPMGSDGIEVGGHVTPVAEATIALVEQDR